MTRRFLIVLVAFTCPLLALARAVRVLDMKSLISGAKLVFVGRVISVAPSGITTTMSYPTWQSVTFEWLKVEVEVLEPIKGVQKRETVRTLMLSAKGDAPMFNAPGMVDPERGKAYLLCLLPTTVSNVYASMTAPWDDDQAIFIQDRNHKEYDSYRKGTVTLEPYVERYGVIWRLVDDGGQILPAGAEAMRKKYRKQIATPPATNAVIYLQWETYKTSGGWQWDVPKGQGTNTNLNDRDKTQNKSLE